MQDLTGAFGGAIAASKIAGDKGLPFGAHIWGAYVVFNYFDPFADRVFVTGSFNGWSESTPMEKIRGGVWTATVSKAACPTGSTYKYKVYDGQECRFVTDPYSEGTDGEPYHNSVVCKKDGYLWGDGSFLDANAIYANGGYEKMPLHVYEVSLRGFFTHHIGASVTYEVAARELGVLLLKTYVWCYFVCNSLCYNNYRR
ncbi:MAG: hypothetical protein IJC64_02095 [Clostridia bacterium]|nr:hypothetical protein [Clostridia bacterium]